MYFNLYCIENNAIIKTWELVRNFQNTVIDVNKSESPIFFEPDKEIPCSGYAPFDYANDECDRFLAAKENEKLQKKEQDENVDGKCKCDLKPVFTAIVESRRLMDEDNSDSIICHRGNESFWRVLFKQNINLSNPIPVILAGEEACDDGGPFREFFFYSMASMNLLSCHFFWIIKQSVF